MPRPGRPGVYEDPAVALGAAADLLSVLHARGQDGVEPAVSPSQLRALLAVEGAEGVNLRTLGDVLGSRPPSVTRLCDRLEAMGLLTRSPHPSRRREVEVRLTPQGRALLDERRAIRVRELSAVLGRMAPEAVNALVAGLEAFREAAAGAYPADDPHTDAGPSAAPAPASVPDSA
ncbi:MULTISPECIES: MarR family winged helix-turn-helix transcriptional regulator [unclassified Streptomyces]|uniref:MarR family winged helix-turn-helix transcriptional regulator n=1 Tax=unclassified Streptomyces TaxID=2593676 RepID=UPI0007C68014|nr:MULTISPECIES: MarR family transcriptional regulator [unclassified Streptomyces]